jgi:hypothetical protein
VRFQNIPEFLSYHSFEIEASADAHTVCRVSFKISLERVEEFISLAELRKQVDITSDNGDRVMTGIVYSVTIDYGVGVAIADMIIISKSIEYQEQGRERIFQNPKKTFEDILKAFPSVIIGKSEHLKDTVEEIIYQHNMDDFSFLVFLAGLCRTRVWINDTGEICFGLPGTKHSFDSKAKNRSRAILNRSLKAQKGGRVLNIETLQQLPNGVEISLDQKEYTVCNVHILERYDETRFYYSGYTSPYPECCKTSAALITKARVTSQKDPDNLGRIQVQFLSFEDNDSDKSWIPVLTPFIGKNNGGIVTVPDEDDEVIVVISDGNAFIVNSIRKDTLPENCQDVSKKHIAIKDSIITLNEESISIANQQSIMVLDDKSISSSVDKSSIKIEAESIESESGKSILILKDKLLQIENGGSTLELENGTTTLKGGSSNLSLDKGKTQISGNKIDFSTQGFSI